VDDLVELAESVFRDREKFREKLVQQDKTLYDILRVGTSAGGAKPKAIIAYNESTGEVRSGQVPAPKGFGYWLLKFDGVSYREHDSITEIPRGIGNVEYAYYKMALRAGIRMNESRILEDCSGCHFMTRRFDRTDEGSKLHMQTLAALTHLDRDARHSYEDAFAAMRKLGLDAKADEEVFRYMVFNVLAKNNDDHTKNISFLMDEYGTWKLAPAYDLCYANNPRSRWINRHQMSVNMKQENITRDDLKAVAERIGIRKYAGIIDQVENAIANWDEIAKDCGVRKNHREEISRELLRSEVHDGRRI
jgi:serine/threonine-protein kinase HipA